MRVDLPLDKKTGKSGLGHRASGPPGRLAAGPSRAVGRGPMGLRAAGPLGRRGPWAAGLLLAKPGPTGGLKYKMFDMSNFADEISRQQRLKRWVVAPFGQARD